MKKFYTKLSKTKKIIFWIVSTILSIFLGGLIGLIFGLMMVTFIPACCNEAGCHNCFEFNGMVGYEATGYIGFFVGLIMFPIMYVSYLIYLIKKKK